MTPSFDPKVLDATIQRTLHAIDEGKTKITEIAEVAIRECRSMQDELRQIEIQVADLIQEVDRLEKAYQFAKQTLSDVSRNFDTYPEEVVRTAYDRAHELQIQLS